MTEVLKITPETSEQIINEAAAAILRGEIIAYPTETFYGLGADANNEEAIRKIFDLKGRDFKNPISVIIGSRVDVYPLITGSTDVAEKLMAFFWPGALTIVFNAAPTVSPLLTAQTGKIGIRLSSHETARRIAQKAGRPLTATSANISGMTECAVAEDVMKQIGNEINIFVDAGATAGGDVSTIIDVTCTPPAILREGAVCTEFVKKIL
ncbi:MAG TPA: threonylcarbamoyl-AMP synthase [Deltaproteobacteria bacterium]|nr:threonylcarbamoyl-AMP synthase [Deltaproteobacteria bacterium]